MAYALRAGASRRPQRVFSAATLRRSRGRIARWGLALALTGLLWSAPAQLAQSEDYCRGMSEDDACAHTTILLHTFVDPGHASDELFNANLSREIDIYLNATPDERNLAAINAELGPKYTPYNIWNMAVPALSDQFNQGDYVSPGNNFPSSAIQGVVDNAYNNTKAISDVLKDQFGQAEIYNQRYGILPEYENEDPRPFQVTEEINGNQWTPANASLIAYEIQQVGGDQFGREAWSELADQPSFPSGHTTEGYTDALLYAIMAPEYYQELLQAGVDFGYSR